MREIIKEWFERKRIKRLRREMEEQQCDKEIVENKREEHMRQLEIDFIILLATQGLISEKRALKLLTPFKRSLV